ncbi:MAG: DUF58 domain-containing protein, partial [Planctomycetales bacterium]|nr:DUF58 domain-containing protein [Planctomycetales bacterium]
CEAGQAIRVRVDVANHAKHDTVWMASAIDSIRRAGTRKRHLVEVWIPHLPPGATRSSAYRLVLSERGRYRLGPLRLQSRFPFGLMRAQLTVTGPARLIVWPRIGQLTPQWRALLRGERVGAQHSQARRGQDGEFYGLRPFTPGDSLRMVHWRSTAKVGEPLVRQTERLELPELALVIDAYLPEHPVAEDLERLEKMLRMAATAVLDICRESGSRVTIAMAHAPSDVWRALPTRRFAEQVLDALAVLEGQASDPDEALRQVTFHAPGATPIVISTRSEPMGLGHSGSRGHTPQWLQVDECEGRLFIDAKPNASTGAKLLRETRATLNRSSNTGNSDAAPGTRRQRRQAEEVAPIPESREARHAEH